MHTTLTRALAAAITLRPLPGIAACALAACAGSDVAAPAPAPDADSQAQELHLTTLANATCTLHALGDDTTALHLGSGPSGRLKFHARRVDAATQPALLELDCRAAEGARDIRRLDLDAMLAEGPSDEPHAEPLRVRPALTDGLESISQRELVLRGYPMRPDAATDSDVYRRWVHSVSMPMRVLEWDREQSDVDFEEHKAAGNWCGAVATSAPYDWAFGQYTEPHLDSSAQDPVQLIGAVWVGVGGTGNDTLIQAGTRQDYAKFFGMETFQHQVFRQVIPPNHPHYCSDCNINEGDEVEFSAQLANPDGSGNGTATLYYWNVTQGEMAAVDIDASSFSGNTAEWVVEDPRSLGDGLPEFGTVTFTSMQTYNDNTGYINFGASQFDTYDIVANAHTYCTPQVLSDSSIAITRQAD